MSFAPTNWSRLCQPPRWPSSLPLFAPHAVRQTDLDMPRKDRHSVLWLLVSWMLLPACAAQPDVIRPGGPAQEAEVLTVPPTVVAEPERVGLPAKRAQSVGVDDDAVHDADDDANPDNWTYRPGAPLTIGPQMQQRCRVLQPTVTETAEAIGADPLLMLAIAWVESGFHRQATSPVGAAGPMQLKPSTAAAMGCRNAYDAACAVRAAHRYLGVLQKRFAGDMVYALCAYHAGHVRPVRAYKAGQLPDNLYYATKVMEARSRLERYGCDGR